MANLNFWNVQSFVVGLLWVNRTVLSVVRLLPIFPRKLRSLSAAAMVERCRRRLLPHSSLQRPIQPSARLYEPLPVLPGIFPVAGRATPSSPTLAER
jgi:hypothetical protein